MIISPHIGPGSEISLSLDGKVSQPLSRWDSSVDHAETQTKDHFGWICFKEMPKQRRESTVGLDSPDFEVPIEQGCITPVL